VFVFTLQCKFFSGERNKLLILTATIRQQLKKHNQKNVKALFG